MSHCRCHFLQVSFKSGGSGRRRAGESVVVTTGKLVRRDDDPLWHEPGAAGGPPSTGLGSRSRQRPSVVGARERRRCPLTAIPTPPKLVPVPYAARVSPGALRRPS
jgi:hypothetical protein